MSPYWCGVLVGSIVGGVVGIVLMSCLVCWRGMVAEWRKGRERAATVDVMGFATGVCPHCARRAPVHAEGCGWRIGHE